MKRPMKCRSFDKALDDRVTGVLTAPLAGLLAGLLTCSVLEEHSKGAAVLRSYKAGCTLLCLLKHAGHCPWGLVQSTDWRQSLHHHSDVDHKEDLFPHKKVLIFQIVFRLLETRR